MVNALEFPFFTIEDIWPTLSPALKLILVALLLVVVIVFFWLTRVYRRGVSGRRLSFTERFIPGKIEIFLTGDQASRPSVVVIALERTKLCRNCAPASRAACALAERFIPGANVIT
jgi:hypothetical protein